MTDTPIDLAQVASRQVALKRAKSRRAVRRITRHRDPGVERLERLVMGGRPHTVLTRGAAPGKPLVLYVHGFLDPALAAARRIGWVSGLEDDFTVVYWERCGYNSAYRHNLRPSAMSFDHAVADATELIDRLTSRYGSGLHLVGHSLGSAIALAAAVERPQSVASVTALAPVIDNKAGDTVVWRQLRDLVEAGPSPRLKRQLRRLGEPPYPANKALSRVSLISRTGGIYAERRAGLARMIYESTIATWRTPEYSLTDLARSTAMIRFVVRSSWDDILALRMYDRVNELAMPVLMVLGRADNGAPPQLAVEYFDHLGAPAGKKLVWFEHSAHFCHVEEPDQLGRHLRDHILAASIPQPPDLPASRLSTNPIQNNESPLTTHGGD